MSRSSLRWFRRGAIAVAVLLVAGFAVGSLAGSKRPDQQASEAATRKAASAPADGSFQRSAGTVDNTATLANPVPAGGGSTASGAEPAGPNLGTLGTLDLPAPPNTVIKTGDVGIQVRKGGVDRAFDRVVDVARKYGGYVLSSGQGGRPIPLAEGRPDIAPIPPEPVPSDGRFADLLIRVPADRFELAIAELTNGEIGKVTRRGFSGQDVGQQFVDLEARLRNAHAQEAVLLRLMAKATSIADTITVQQQLSGVQQQIEELQGRLNYLKNQTQFGTISVHVAEAGAAVESPGDGPSFSKAWDTALEGLKRMAGAGIIGGTILSPFAALAIVALLARRWRARPAAAP